MREVGVGLVNGRRETGVTPGSEGDSTTGVEADSKRRRGGMVEGKRKRTLAWTVALVAIVIAGMWLARLGAGAAASLRPEEASRLAASEPGTIWPFFSVEFHW